MPHHSSLNLGFVCRRRDNGEPDRLRADVLPGHGRARPADAHRALRQRHQRRQDLCTNPRGTRREQTQVQVGKSACPLLLHQGIFDAPFGGRRAVSKSGSDRFSDRPPSSSGMPVVGQ